jgi:hypothetical protein
VSTEPGQHQCIGMVRLCQSLPPGGKICQFLPLSGKERLNGVRRVELYR